MFGHQSDQQDSNHHHDDQPMDNVLSAPAADAVLGDDASGATTVSDSATTFGDGDPNFNPAIPMEADSPVPSAATTDSPLPSSDPTTDLPTVPDTNNALASPDSPTSPTSPASPADDNLLDLKQQALTQLSPLVGHLDQTPEEKFHTTMMMIQAADNQSLIPVAYEAAQQITDEKVKAQALLDVINEINYFTQKAND